MWLLVGLLARLFMTVLRAGLFLWGVFCVSGLLSAEEDQARFFREQVQPLLSLMLRLLQAQHLTGYRRQGLLLQIRTFW